MIQTRSLDALQAILDGDTDRARIVVAELRLELANPRCDGCGEEFPTRWELMDALADRRNGEYGHCGNCLRGESWGQ
jgi:hypothetical protein